MTRKKPKYSWKIGERPPFIDSHSKNKHSIYAGYLRRYIKKLTQDPRHPSFRLAIVDGFCGGGIYLDSNNEEYFGSPFIVFTAINEALADARENRDNPLTPHLRYYFVDNDCDAIEYLQHAHAEHEINKDSIYSVEYLCDKFSNIYQKIIDDIKRHAPRTQRTLLLLDQYGWSKVPLDIINSIFSQLSDAEIILTFTPDEIIDYVGNDEKSMNNIARTFRSMGFDITPQDIVEIVRPENHPNKWMARVAAQEFLADAIRNKTSARYFTNYYVKSVKNHRSLMLIHLSQHQAAHNEMMEEHWNNSNINLNHQGYTGVSPLMLGYNYKYDNQFLFLEEDFFRQQKEVIVKAMIQQVPIILDAYPVGLPFGELMHQIIRNTSPVTVDIMKQVIDKLIQYKGIDVIHHKTGKARRRCTSGLHPNDQIKLAQQRTLFV